MVFTCTAFPPAPESLRECKWEGCRPGTSSGFSSAEKLGRSFMNLGALLLKTVTTNTYLALTSARHFVMGSLCIIPFNSHNSLRGSALLSCPCYTGGNSLLGYRGEDHQAVEAELRLKSAVCNDCYYPLDLQPLHQWGSTTAEPQGVSTHVLLLDLHKSPRSWGWCLQVYVAMGSRGWGWSTRPLRGAASVRPGFQGDL